MQSRMGFHFPAPRKKKMRSNSNGHFLLMEINRLRTEFNRIEPMGLCDTQSWSIAWTNVFNQNHQMNEPFESIYGYGGQSLCVQPISIEVPLIRVAMAVVTAAGSPKVCSKINSMGIVCSAAAVPVREKRMTRNCMLALSTQAVVRQTDDTAGSRLHVHEWTTSFIGDYFRCWRYSLNNYCVPLCTIE